jgi:hypothetical protein
MKRSIFIVHYVKNVRVDPAIFLERNHSRTYCLQCCSHTHSAVCHYFIARANVWYGAVQSSLLLLCCYLTPSIYQI